MASVAAPSGVPKSPMPSSTSDHVPFDPAASVTPSTKFAD